MDNWKWANGIYTPLVYTCVTHIHWTELLHWITYTGLTFDLHVHVIVILFYAKLYN